MYRNALVPIDGSETSWVALEQVREVVEPTGRVLLIGVVDDAGRVATRTTPAGFEFSSFAASMSIIDDMIEAQRREAEGHLAEARETLARDGFENVETVLAEGLPGPLIVETAEGQDCDVIIMGTHGRSGFRRALLGSVAEHVVRHLHGIPVVLVRSEDGSEDDEEIATGPGRETGVPTT